jgi:hypothetical protein
VSFVRTPTTRLLALIGLVIGNFFTGCSQPDGATSADDTAAYQRFLSITKVDSYYHTEPETKTKYPVVQGTLTNLGPETLSVVEFKLRYMDSLHRVTFEEQTYPVYVSSLMGPSTDPLAPGQKTRFAFRCSKCPSNWQPGQVDIQISKVVFSRRAAG